MKVTLINPYNFAGPGIRSIAALLRKEGLRVQCLFLLLDTRFLIHSSKELDCSPRVLDEIVDVCRDSDLIGITLMSSAFKAASDITQHIKRTLKAPVIWGGIHPTISPEECLKFADMVCIGEGESPMLNLTGKIQKNTPYFDTEGIWFRQNGKLIKNKIPPLLQNLNDLPRDNFENPNDKVLQKQNFVPVNYDIATELMGTQYEVYTSRGCPYRCSFCCNNVLKELYKGQKVVRHRSPSNVVKEISNIISRFKKINRVFFSDDSFIVRPVADIKEFSELYKKEVNLPFSCLITAPSADERKVKYLVEAGMNDIRLGLQSASPNTLKLYNRPITAQSVKKAAMIINKCLDGSQIPSYDIILDNPCETKEDLVTTLKFLINLPRPFSLRLYSLQLYPGTQLYKRALDGNGLMTKFRNAYRGSYRSPEGTYLNSLFYLMKLIGIRRCPPIVGKILLTRGMLRLLDNSVVNTMIKGLRDARSVWKYSIKLRIKFLNRQAPPIIKKWYTNV